MRLPLAAAAALCAAAAAQEQPADFVPSDAAPEGVSVAAKCTGGGGARCTVRISWAVRAPPLRPYVAYGRAVDLLATDGARSAVRRPAPELPGAAAADGWAPRSVGAEWRNRTAAGGGLPYEAAAEFAASPSTLYFFYCGDLDGGRSHRTRGGLSPSMLLRTPSPGSLLPEAVFGGGWTRREARERSCWRGGAHAAVSSWGGVVVSWAQTCSPPAGPPRAPQVAWASLAALVAAPAAPWVAAGSARSAGRNFAHRHVPWIGANATLWALRAELPGPVTWRWAVYVYGDVATGDSLPVLLRLPPSGGEPLARLAVFGDLGLAGGHAAALLSGLSKRHAVDAAIHCGDLAYGDDWPGFLATLEGAAEIPYMIAAGNHDIPRRPGWWEQWPLDLHFAWPGWREQQGTGRLWWSADFGPVHVAVIMTEKLENHMGVASAVYVWLRADLHRANLNRHRVPWVVVVGHRPMYSSARWLQHGYDKRRRAKVYMESRRSVLHRPQDIRVRHGPPLAGGRPFAFERLLRDAGVNIYFAGHAHGYERHLPGYRGEASSDPADPYRGPTVPTHIVVATGGSAEGLEPFSRNPVPSSAVRLMATGLGVLRASKGQLRWSFLACGWERCAGEVLDNITITRAPG